MPYNPRYHHRHSIRLPGYDYTRPGAYFITICVQDRECLLGEVVDGEMRLSAWGRIVQAAWFELPRHYPTLTLDAFCIMPNHLHGIIVLNDPAEKNGPIAGNRRGGSVQARPCDLNSTNSGPEPSPSDDKTRPVPGQNPSPKSCAPSNPSPHVASIKFTGVLECPSGGAMIGMSSSAVTRNGKIFAITSKPIRRGGRMTG